MEITTLAVSVLTALTPYLTKGAEKFVEKAGEETFTKRGIIWNQVKSLFKNEELVLLNLFEKYPENTDIKTEIAEKLKEKLEANPVTAKDLEGLISQLHNIQNKENVILQNGQGNIAIQDISNSSIKVSK